MQRWRELVEARDEQSERLGLGSRRHDFWTRRAPNFARFSSGVRRDDPVIERVRAQMPAGDGRVLDVGAGTGRYAIPLAELGARVTAIEPNGAMADLLEQDARARGVSVAMERGEWPAAAERVGSGDVVLCAHVVYPIADVVGFIRALDRAARCAVVLVARLGQPDEVAARMFPLVHGEERIPMPNLPELYNVLLQIGIPASVTLHPFETRWNFPDAEAAITEVAARLGVEDDPERRARIETAVRSRLVPRGGEVWLAPREAYQGVVWWEAGTRIDPAALFTSAM